MKYLLTGIDTHLDFGFGITGESYYDSAEYLFNNKEAIKSLQQKEMPMAFLYRHSVELYLKSLIVIFHKQLQLPYDIEPFDSKKPQILTGGKWKNLYACHWIDELYNYWLNELLLKHKAKLGKLAPKGEWQEETTISNLFPLIASYDRDSSFFRYPITKNSTLDSKKYTMQHADVKKIQKILSSNPNTSKSQQGRVFTLIKNDKGEFVNGFAEEKSVLSDVIQALKKVSSYFNSIHTMTRCTLCDGF